MWLTLMLPSDPVGLGHVLNWWLGNSFLNTSCARRYRIIFVGIDDIDGNSTHVGVQVSRISRLNACSR